MYDANPALPTRHNLDHQIIARSVREADVPRGSAYDPGASDHGAQHRRNDEGTIERLQSAVTELFYVISAALQNDQSLFGESIRRAAELLQIDVTDIFARAGETPESGDSTPPRGGLAPWQVRKIRHFVDENLDSVIRVDDLASQAKLSRCHFSRAFRQSFDQSPHAYIMRRRIERAQGLMLTSAVPLGQIAAECGLADQAHLTKLFKRIVGESPGVWRRARASLP